MNPRTFTPEQQARINIVWEHFKKTLEWPSWKALINEHPAEFEHLPSDYTADDVYVSKEVSLSFETIMTMPEARQLLQPFPQLLRLAARRFIEHPAFDGDIERVGITNEDFARIWSDRKQMILAYALITRSRIRLGGGRSSKVSEPGAYGPASFAFHCSYDVLRYENVQSFDEALEIASSRGASVGATPPDQHQRLMKAVFDHAVRHGEWPVGLPFAIEHRSIGYIPQLVDDLLADGLEPIFVRSRFDSSKHSRICLNIWAVPFIDPSGELRSLLTRAITTIAQLWKKSPAAEDEVSISLAELSTSLGLTPLEAAPVALLLEGEPWIRGGNFRRYADWCAGISREILDYRAVPNWDKYLEVRAKRRPVPHLLRSQPSLKEGIYNESGLDIPTSPPGFAEPDFDHILNPLQNLFALQPTSLSVKEREQAKTPNVHNCDVAVICALHSPELEKLINTGKEEWKKLPSDPDDPQRYHQGLYTTLQGNHLRIIAAATNQMGPHAAAALTAKIILRFRPRLVAMVGIAAGATIDADGFGDILAPDTTFDYTSGKVSTTNGEVTFTPDPKPLHINSRLLTSLRDWKADGRDLIEIWRKWPGPRPPRPPKLLIGPLGSGSSVVAHRKVVDDVGTHWRKLIGLEMEAYAAHYACRDTITPETPYLALKSICDFGDNAKSDTWQPYAAYTAAEALHLFLIREWENLHLHPLPVR
jgi:nucleoside phosphorylase